jgi:hypothetical protein
MQPLHEVRQWKSITRFTTLRFTASFPTKLHSTVEIYRRDLNIFAILLKLRRAIIEFNF